MLFLYHYIIFFYLFSYFLCSYLYSHVYIFCIIISCITIMYAYMYINLILLMIISHNDSFFFFILSLFLSLYTLCEPYSRMHSKQMKTICYACLPWKRDFRAAKFCEKKRQCFTVHQCLSTRTYQPPM